MRAVALVPSLSLIAGSIGAQLVTTRVEAEALGPLRLESWLVAAVAVALVALLRGRPVLLVWSVAAAFAVGGVSLTVRAWAAALSPPLRVAWHAASRVSEDRPGPDVDGPTERPVFAVLTGVLQSDAAVRPDGVSLAVAVVDARIEGRTPQGGEDLDGGPRHERSRPDRTETTWERRRSPRPTTSPRLGGVLLSVGGHVAPDVVRGWRAGRTIRVSTRLRRPSRHLNPGVPDEERDLARRGTTLVGSVKSGMLVELVGHGSWWSERAAEARAFVRRAIPAHVPGTAASGLVTAILIGDRAGLSPDVQRRLQDAGTYHVVAISGGNIAILAAATLALFRWAGLLGRTAMIVAVVGFLVFGTIVEGGASVDRAVTMAVLSFLGRAADHRVDSRHGLAVAAAFLVVADPLVSADPGFLLSCAATGGLVIGVPMAGARGWSRPVAVPLLLVAASLAAELASLPLVALLFGRATLAGLALNLVAVPLMGVTQSLGLAVVALTPISQVGADVAGGLARVSADALIGSASLVEWAPGLARRVARPSAAVVVAHYAGLALAVWAWQKLRTGQTGPASARRLRGLRLGVVASICAPAWIVLQPWAWLTGHGDGLLHVTFIDVGQGDAALVRFPRGSTLLVDAGGGSSSAYDVGDRVVGPTLRALGVLSLDTVVVTHPDVDHAGGVSTVLREFRPFDVWEGVPVPPLALHRSLRDQAERLGARWINVQPGDLAQVDGVRVIVHHPPVPDWERQSTRNDDSVVIELVWRHVSIVLAGDIGRDAEASLERRFDRARLRVLKVPHHGSRSSSTPPFLAALGPRIAIVSAGRGNAFGHPSPVVLERYRAVGSDILRTDRDGAIDLSTDGWRVQARTFTGRTLTARPPSVGS